MNNETEKIIFDAALEVFQEKGFAIAKLKDIAEKVKINQSLLHYYFRNKKTLFKSVLKYKILELFNKLGSMPKEDRSLKENINDMIPVYQNYFLNNPQMPLFFITELNNNPDIIKELITKNEIEKFKQSKTFTLKNLGLKANTNIPLDQLFLTLISIIVFPFLAKEMMKLIFDQDESQSMKFLENRGQLLPSLINNILT